MIAEVLRDEMIHVPDAGRWIMFSAFAVMRVVVGTLTALYEWRKRSK